MKIIIDLVEPAYEDIVNDNFNGLTELYVCDAIKNGEVIKDIEEKSEVIICQTE